MRGRLFLILIGAAALVVGIVAAWPMLLAGLGGAPAIAEGSSSALGVAAHRLGLPPGSSARRDTAWRNADGTAGEELRFAFTVPGDAAGVTAFYRAACARIGFGPPEPAMAASVPDLLCAGRIAGRGPAAVAVTPRCRDGRCTVAMWLM